MQFQSEDFVSAHASSNFALRGEPLLDESTECFVEG